MGALSRLASLRRNKAFKIVLGGSALGVGAAAGTAVGHDSPKAPEPVSLGRQSDASEMVALQLEKKRVRVKAEAKLARDTLDASLAASQTPDSPDAATADTVGTGTGSSPSTADSPPTADSPDSPATPPTPDTPPSPDSPDTPPTADSPPTPDSPPTADSPDDEGSGDQSEDEGSGEEDDD